MFRNWVLENFPFLENDFDALTDYELFCKMMQYVKEFAKDNEDFKKQLDSYENYFNNLDVQEEINNKLDEMADDGTLENIISQYIELKTTYVYNSVAEMKASTNLANGSFARTSGFYSYNDDGGAYYKIRTITNNDEIDDITLIELTDENLVAELILLDCMNVKMFGAKGDSSHDDTINIQKCLDNCKKIIINNGTYMIDAEISISPKSNSNIELVNATLKAITNSAENYDIVKFNNVSNVSLCGGTIQGDRDTHTGLTGEWGHCIGIYNNSTNINIKNIVLVNAWGDGLYLGNGKNITTQNVIVDNARRNGYSIINVENFKSLNDTIKNINGTAPEAGIDIEPNNNEEKIKNVVFDNLNTYNCSGSAFEIMLSNQNNNSDEISIVLNNLYDEESENGLSIVKNQYTKGQININQPILINNKLSGINLRQAYNSDLRVSIVKPKVINCNRNENNSPKYGSPITCFIESTDAQYNLGNIEIIEPFLTSYYSNDRYAYIVGASGYNIKNFKFINPLNNDNNKQLTLQGIDNLLFKDDYGQFIINNDYSNEIASYNTFSKLLNQNYTTSRTVTIMNDFPVGREMTFMNIQYPETYDINIKIPDGTYIRKLSENDGITIKLSDYNDMITLKRISTTDFVITELVGSVTLSE